ncbi:MAG: hypothetical protein KDD61_03225 [Bdellovibrionales bacterium]|nr:hypothetical protein [Bdellovibrionales bacterium]
MTEALHWNVLVFVLVVALVTVGLGAMVLWQKDSTLHRWTPGLVSVGSGILLSLCFVEFFPRSFAGEPKSASLFVLLGILLVMVSDRYIAPLIFPSKCGTSCEAHNFRQPHDHGHASISIQTTCSSIGCILICSLFDGFEISAGFQIGDKSGMLISSAVILHSLPVGAVVAGLGIAGGLSKASSLKGVILVGLFMLIGSLVGLSAVSLMSFQNIVLPVASGVLIYVSLGHLLPASLNYKYGVLGVLFGATIVLALSH